MPGPAEESYGGEVLGQAKVVRWGYDTAGPKATQAVLQLIVDWLNVCLKIFFFPTLLPLISNILLNFFTWLPARPGNKKTFMRIVTL